MGWQQIPFGEYPQLAAEGMINTGSENYGGGVSDSGRIALHRSHKLR